MYYDPAEYWIKRGKIYQSNFVYNQIFRAQEKFLLNHIKGLSFNTVLEVGCGFGRITKQLLENFPETRYTAVDLSPDQIENAKRFVNNSKVNFAVSDIQSFSSVNKFDLVLAVEVLLHIKPEDINSTISKLLSLTNKYFVHVDWHEEITPPEYTTDSYCFMHDFDEIYSRLGLQYNKYKIDGKRRLFGKIDAKQAVFIVKT
ncbi:MAG TPA: class I SAM-dependent methyltransferase [Nitrososphaera sp.]|nr:class I SAM-dependent methyltransferase [Nitrososphaera sp.]